MLSRRILVADDDRLLRESICDALGELGCTTHQVGNGARALESLRQSPCDLVVSDIDMPDMSGFALLSWLTQLGLRPQPVVILMSARADRSLDLAAQRAGAAALLAKPVGFPYLATLIETIFSRRDPSHPERT